MELNTQIASPSLTWAESPPRWKFDVFLSFRGEDTRRGFISHLYHQLQFWHVFKTFKDDREVALGADISPELLSAIEHSHLAIVVLSPNYASSTWCLDELAKIIESMETPVADKRILPVFYDVDPSDVRHQRSSFADAFAKHEVKFSNDIEKVKRWRAALRKVASFSGWDAKNYRDERELIEDIVKHVLEKVCPTITLSDSSDKLVGIDFALMEMGKLLLAPEENDVRYIGIWGMGGVGKTTIARLVFERISHHFEVAEFLVGGTTVDLQKQILSSILNENVSQVRDEYKGTSFIRKFLSNKKVLLVVDNVDHYDQLTRLIGNKSWFGERSIIIVTTRDKRLLTEHDIERQLKVEGLNSSQALELFSQHAFKKDQPVEGFSELSSCFVHYAKGLPLALKILGRSLYKRDLEAWKSGLDKLKKIPDPTIFENLKLSYDMLDDDMQRNIFLDVAFFYKQMEKGRVIEILENCGFCGRIGIDILIEKSLLTSNVGMHGLVQEMTWEIVRQESPEEPGLRSRLCHRNDIFHVFMTNSGTEAIRGIRLCLPQLEEADSRWNCECFSKMVNLTFLEFDNLIISSGPKFLPNSLIILRWDWYPSGSLPANFRPNILAELRMENSNLVRLWDGRQDLPNLKDMNLSESKKLRKTPDFTGIPNLEKLYLKGCESLVEVHPSIAFNKKLKQLRLNGCKNLNSFPNKIEMDSLEYLSLFECLKIKCPEFGEGMKSLSSLGLSRTASTLSEVLSSIRHLVGLEYLYLHHCKSVRSPLRQTCGGGSSSRKGKLKMGFIRALFGSKSPQRLCLAVPSPWALPSLTWLCLSNCNLGQGVIPDDIGYCFPSLKYLDLGGNNFVSLPAGSIKCLTKLQFLNLSSCKRLEQLPDLSLNWELRVNADNCDSLKKLSEPSQHGRCTYLGIFQLKTENCFGLVDNQGLNNGIFSMLRRLAAQGISHYLELFRIVSPGSKISKWFDIQSEGDSLTVELLPPDRETEWIGILFCVLFAPLEEYDHLWINCSSPGIDTEGILVVSSSRRMRGDHLGVFFLSRSKIQDTTSDHMNFSFHAHTRKSQWPKSVKRCGARMLYEQDLKDLFNKLKRSREYCEKDESPSGSSIKESLLKRQKP